MKLIDQFGIEDKMISCAAMVLAGLSYKNENI